MATVEENPPGVLTPSDGPRSGGSGRSSTSLVRSPAVLFCLAFLLSALGKMSALHSRELWLDETYSAYIANLPFSELIHRTAGDVHPPLFYMLLWGWVRIAGDAQAQLRLFSVVLSLCATLAMLALGRRVLGGGAERWPGHCSPFRQCCLSTRWKCGCTCS